MLVAPRQLDSSGKVGRRLLPLAALDVVAGTAGQQAWVLWTKLHRALEHLRRMGDFDTGCGTIRTHRVVLGLQVEGTQVVLCRLVPSLQADQLVSRIQPQAGVLRAGRRGLAEVFGGPVRLVVLRIGTGQFHQKRRIVRCQSGGALVVLHGPVPMIGAGPGRARCVSRATDSRASRASNRSRNQTASGVGSVCHQLGPWENQMRSPPAPPAGARRTPSRPAPSRRSDRSRGPPRDGDPGWPGPSARRASASQSSGRSCRCRSRCHRAAPPLADVDPIQPPAQVPGQRRRRFFGRNLASLCAPGSKWPGCARRRGHSVPGRSARASGALAARRLPRPAPAGGPAARLGTPPRPPAPGHRGRNAALVKEDGQWIGSPIGLPSATSQSWAPLPEGSAVTRPLPSGVKATAPGLDARGAEKSARVPVAVSHNATPDWSRTASRCPSGSGITAWNPRPRTTTAGEASRPSAASRQRTEEAVVSQRLLPSGAKCSSVSRPGTGRMAQSSCRLPGPSARAAAALARAKRLPSGLKATCRAAGRSQARPDRLASRNVPQASLPRPASRKMRPSGEIAAAKSGP